MNKRMIMLMAAALALLSARGQVSFTGTGVAEHPPIEISLSDNHTSLNKIFVLFNTDGVKMTYTATTNEPVVWINYDWRGGELYTDTIRNITYAGTSSTLSRVRPDTGYEIKEGSTTHYYWVVNYANHYLELNDLFFNNEEPCSLVSFNVDGHGDAISYYEVNGHRQVLDREIKLTYNTLVWNDSTHWQQEEVVETFAALDQGVEIAPPLCNTLFVMTGDRFLEEWGLREYAESDYYHTQAVACNSTAELQDVETDDETEDGSETEEETGIPNTPLSAPVHILFTGYPTDAVVYRVWEMSTDPEFENAYTNLQDVWDYTFNDAGTYYVRYMVANADGTCEAYGDVYTVIVSESQLGVGPRGELPNAFSPGTTEGVNDVWKVTYKSLAEFHCWIFNRWGNLVYEYTDPDGGWDGTYRGKLVDTGVYYYVITATGTDGVKYRKRGDISILRYKRGGGGTMGDGSGGL